MISSAPIAARQQQGVGSLASLGLGLAIALTHGLRPLLAGETIGRSAVHEVLERHFQGPQQGPRDAPARDVDFRVRFPHTEDAVEHTVHGFWDGDGRGGSSGHLFIVRCTPTRPGAWELADVISNREELAGQRRGDLVTARPSEHPGFWVVDEASPERRWYRRSDGSHPYIYGNTHYSFLSGYETGNRPSGNSLPDDIAAQLPPGTWRLTPYDAIAREVALLHTAVRGRLVFDAPPSRAVLSHLKKCLNP